MNAKKFNQISTKMTKKTGNEFWFVELGKYEQNVCKDIIATRNINDATDEIIRRFF